MNKAQLIMALNKKQRHLTKKDVTLAVDIILAQMEQSLNSKERIEIRGFGAFIARQLPARSGTNPQTGKDLHISARIVFRFKPSKGLKLVVDKGKDTIQIKESLKQPKSFMARPFNKAHHKRNRQTIEQNQSVTVHPETIGYAQESLAKEVHKTVKL